jgi:hypothetical protein
MVVGGKIANMRQGERTDLELSANLPNVKRVSQAQAAELLNVGDPAPAAHETVVAGKLGFELEAGKGNGA